MENKNELKGLGGWLILFGIIIILSPIRLLVTYIPPILKMFNDGTWEALTTVGSEAYHPLWGSLLIGEIIFNLGIVAAFIYLIYLFFSKHYLLPKFFIAIAVVSLIFISLDAWLVKLVQPNEPMFDPETTIQFARTLILGLIWIPYMLVSKRVKATFVEKKPNKQMQPTLTAVRQESPKSQIFFQVSKTKLVVLSVVTFGIYEVYWFYKNWKFLKETQDLKILPFLRALFSYIFFYSLFKRIQEYAKENNVRTEYSPGWLTAGYILLSMTYKSPEPFWCLTILTVLTLLPARSVIDDLNAKLNPTEKINSRFSGWNVVTIIFGVILWGFVIFGMTMPDDDSPKTASIKRVEPNVQYNDKSNVAGIDPALDKLSSKKIFNKSNESVVLIRVYDENGDVVSFGSGVCMSSNGAIITNFHVLNSDSTYFDIKFLRQGVFEDVDIAGISPICEDYIVLKVDGKDLPSVNMSTRNKYDVGEKIITIGNPEGLLNSISEGIISGRRFYGDYEYYQMTAPISHGSSGGAVFDEYGYLIGMSTAILEEGQNLNFFLPIYRIENNAEIFDTVLTLEQFNSLCRSRAEEYKKTGDQYLLSKDYEQANNNYEISLKYYDSNADAYYANSTALYQLGLEDEALADLIGAALLYYHYDEKDKLLYVKRRAEEMSLPAEVVDVFDIQNMEKLLKGYNKDDDLRKLFRSKDDLTKDLLQFKGKSDENDVSQNLGLFSSGLIVSGGKSGVNILKISQVCPAWEAGLRGGDIITEIEGKEINSLEGYVEIMQNLNKTRRLKIALVVHRQGVLYNVSIKRTN